MKVCHLQGLNEELVCKNHLILGQHLYKNLEGRDFDLYGGGKFRSKGNKVRLSTAIQLVSNNNNNGNSNHQLEFPPPSALSLTGAAFACLRQI